MGLYVSSVFKKAAVGGSVSDSFLAIQELTTQLKQKRYQKGNNGAINNNSWLSLSANKGTRWRVRWRIRKNGSELKFEM